MSKYVPVLLGKNSEYVPVYPDADGNYYALRPDSVRRPSDTNTEPAAEDFDELLRDDEDEELVADDMADDEADESYIEEETEDYPTAQAKVSTRLYQPAPGGASRQTARLANGYGVVGSRYVPAPYSPNGRSTPPSADELTLVRLPKNPDKLKVKPNFKYTRGVDYPKEYQGFIDKTYVLIQTVRDHKGTKVALQFDAKINGEQVQTRFYDFKQISSELEQTIIWFHDGKSSPIYGKPAWKYCTKPYHFWPKHQLGCELFDRVRIVVQGERSIRLHQVKIVLNGTSILWRDFHDRKISGTFHLYKWIIDYRLRKVPHSDVPILRAAALEYGKGWCPKYGGLWEKKSGKFKDKPEKWCTEFAAWLISKGTDLNPPRDDIRGNWDLARYFYGLWNGTDLENSRRFITPSRSINNISDSEKDIYISEKRNNVKINPVGCGWNELPNKIRPGFYAKIKRGGDVSLKNDFDADKIKITFDGKNLKTDPGMSYTTDDEGHSTFFVEWNNAFRKNRKWNEFRAIGGNQDDMVKIKVYNIDKEDNVRYKRDTAFGFEGAKYEKLNDIFWKATRAATGKYGYPDGFGITDMPLLKLKRKL